MHGQLTNVTQGHSDFTSPYSGTNSLAANGQTEETTDITLYAGVRPWRGAELWLDPEVDQGFGLSNTVGIAGFTSGEAYKIGATMPYLRLPELSSARSSPWAAPCKCRGRCQSAGGGRGANRQRDSDPR